MNSSWFLCAVLTTLFWAGADLFYKKGAETSDKHSHLKTAIMVGLVMGIHAVFYMILTDASFNPVSIVTYLPVSFCYILSMVLGYVGLRYLELSVSSPVQNSSGAVSAIIMVIFAGVESLELSSASGVINIIGVVIITFGVVWLAIVEKKEDNLSSSISAKEKKYVSGLMAISFPILYCVFDSLGTALDGIYLDTLSLVTEDEALLAYEFTFLIVAVVCLIYLVIFKKEKLSFKSEKNRGIAAVFETAGQFFYVFAMSGKAYIAAPMIASYCIFSVILSRIFLKEKLSKLKYATVITVMVGILLLGVAEGFAENESDETEDLSIAVEESLEA